MNIKKLAEIMKQTESDTQAFINCLKVWIDKGYTIDQAIIKHMEQMVRLVDNSTKLPKSIVVDTFYPMLNSN